MMSVKLMEFPATIGLTLGFGGAGAWLGPAIGASAGEMGVLCGLPAAIGATLADRRSATAASLTLGAVGTIGLGCDLVAAVDLAGPAVGFASAIAALVLAGARRHEHEQHLLDLERLRQREPVEPLVALAADAQTPSEETVLGYATSLLSLQEAGRRIATHLDLETLVPTVVTTARSALKCRYAAVYFWDASDRTLVASLPPRLRDAGRFVPDSSRGVAHWVISTRQVFVAQSAIANPELASLAASESRLPAGIAPLLVGDELFGLLVVDEAEHLDPSFARMLYVLANLAALGLKNAELFRRVEEAARRDPLTGLLNRGGFEAACVELAATADPMTLLLSDLDHFKQLNDAHGHQAGDLVLREAARLWRTVLPPEAIIARYGGEEFVAVLPGCDLERGKALAEALRSTLARHPFRHGGWPLSVTASFGLAGLEPSCCDLEGLLHHADEALYRAKAEGRNRICLAPSAERDTVVCGTAE